MLPRNKRLNLAKDFKRAASGKKLETAYLKLFLKEDPGNAGFKLGIAASAKIFSKAVARNKAKRLVSAAFEALFSRLPDNINIVALPKAGAVKVKSDDIRLDLEAGLKKEGIIV